MTIDLPLSRAWTKGTFTDFLETRGFPGDRLEAVRNDLADRVPLDQKTMSELNREFEEFMGNDLSCATVARMITVQGYETVNYMNEFIKTIVNGRLTNIYLMTGDAPSPTGRRRTVALGRWNVSVRGGVDIYPLFTAGILSAVDPMFNGRSETIPKL